MADKANGVVTYVAEYETHGAFMRGSDSRIVRGGRFVAESDYEQLQAKLEAAERDAARWQWLRENAHPGFTQSGKAWGLLCASLEVRTWPQIDAAIDAAIDAQRQEGK